jgi:hypothetical protein
MSAGFSSITVCALPAFRQQKQISGLEPQRTATVISVHVPSVHAPSVKAQLGIKNINKNRQRQLVHLSEARALVGSLDLTTLLMLPKVKKESSSVT